MKSFIKLFTFFILFFTISLQSVFGLEKFWYYTATPKSEESLRKNIDKIDVFAPQVYYLRDGGEVIGSLSTSTLDFVKSKNKQIIPLVANISYTKNDTEFFNRKMLHAFLDDKNSWAKLSIFLRNEAKKNGYNGWQIDFENMDVSYKNTLTEFMKFLNTELKKDNLSLSIAVVSKISDYRQDYSSDYWRYWAGVYDYVELAKYADFLSIMAYDQPESPGPVATLDWSKRVMKYTLDRLPKEKISFGIPVYAWGYRARESKRFLMTDFELAKLKLEKKKEQDEKKKNYTKVEMLKDFITGSGRSLRFGNVPWVSYNYNGKNYTVWYEDALSFRAKAKHIEDSGVRGYSVWVLGSEDPSIWN